MCKVNNNNLHKICNNRCDSQLIENIMIIYESVGNKNIYNIKMNNTET